jgi:hypothetical protein
LNDKNATLGWRFFCPIETHIYSHPWFALQVFKRGHALACSKNAFNAPSDGVFGGGLSLLRLYSGACFQHKMNESIKPTL